MTWEKGKSGNPTGRLPRAKEDKYLQTLGREMKITDWRDIVRRAVTDAKRGDSKARQWLSDYGIGKPSQRIDIGNDNKLEIVITHADDVETTETTSETE